jgi:hypothetical protein
MPVRLSCKGCKSTLRVRDDLAGKKVKCPRCGAANVVPAALEEFAPVEVVPEERIRGVPAGPRQARRRDEPEEEDDRRSGGRKARDRDRDRDRDDREDRGRKPKYQPCPQCGASGARRVTWTPWGSFYGPALFSHVRCPDCGYCYNGKTGGSNLIPAILFVTVPLLGIFALLGAVAYIVVTRLRLFG